MASGLAQQQSRLKELISRGREQGYLTYSEVNDHLPDEISDPDQIEDIIGMINDMGIAVHEVAPERDELLQEADDTDELAAEEAAAVLVAVENEAGRTTDPVRMYMREMGTVELLTREGEIIIAKRIEEGIRDILHALSSVPGVVQTTIDAYDSTQEDDKLTDLLIGFLDPAEYVPPAAQVMPGAKQEKKDDDEEEERKGPDPVMAAERFEACRKQVKKTERAIKKHGRDSAQGQKELKALGDKYQFFKMVPKHMEIIVAMARQGHNVVRKQERIVMSLCVKHGKMQRKDFIERFMGHEEDL